LITFRDVPGRDVSALKEKKRKKSSTSGWIDRFMVGMEWGNCQMEGQFLSLSPLLVNMSASAWLRRERAMHGLSWWKSWSHLQCVLCPGASIIQIVGDVITSM